MTRPLRAAPAVVAVLVGAAFVGHSLVSLARHHLTVLHKDQWRIYHDYFNLPFLEAILKDQNGHLKIFPALLYFADIHWFAAGNTFLVVLGNLLAALTAGLYTRFIVREPELSAPAKAILSTFVWVALFWLASFVALGWGNVGVNTYLVSALLTLSLALVLRGDTQLRRARSAAAWRSLAAACVLALVATFSFGSGIVVFPTLVFCALAVRLPARMTISLAGATAAAAALLLAVAPSGKLLGRVALEPLKIGQQLGQWLGSPWFHMTKGTALFAHEELLATVVAPLMGLALLGVAALAGLRCLKRRSGGHLAPFLTSITVFGAALAVLGVGLRGGLSESTARFFLAPRYMTWSLLAWVAMICLLALLAGRLRGPWAFLRYTLLAAIALTPILLWPSHLLFLRAYTIAGMQNNEAAVGLLVGVQDPDKVRRHLFRDPAKVFRVAEQLRQRQLNVFARGWHEWIGQPVDALFPPAPEARCTGRVTRLRSLPDGERRMLRLGGWARVEGSPEVMVIVDRGRVVSGLAVFTGTRPPPDGAGAASAHRFFGYSRVRERDQRLLVVLDENRRRICGPGISLLPSSRTRPADDDGASASGSAAP